MLTKLDDAKNELLAKAADVGDGRMAEGQGPSAPADTLGFLRRYYRHVPAEDMLGRDPVDVYGAALSHRQLASARPQGTANIRVFTPTVEEHGWSCGHTVVEIVTDDMPFIVDSVTAALSADERSIHLVIHPQLVVRRDVAGAMLEVLDVAEPPGPETVVESWTHVEIDRETDASDIAQITRALQKVLLDVREAVEDWRKMRAVAQQAADELDSPPPDVPGAEVSEAQALLRWLADDHFTFLGYREYVLADEDGDEVLRAVPGTGLGILRADQPVSTSFAKLSPEVRAKAHEHSLLILTKANSRSTVHRPSYLDYIGVKTFDADGAVRGERRFLGLFTSVAYTESIMRIPVLRRLAEGVLTVSGFSANSHSGKDLLEILETYPRDELFQSSLDELLPIAMSVLHLQERRQLRLFVRADAYGRFISCLVYLPRDRYTTAARLRIEQILREVFHADSVDYTTRVSESVLARLHYVVRTRSLEAVRDMDVAEIERRLVEATRSWSDAFAESLVSQVGEEDASRLLRSYGNGFPEAYKEDFPARTAVADLRRLDGLDPTGRLEMNLYEPYGAAPGVRRLKVYRGSPVSLSDVLPALQRMGVEVVDERPYEIERSDGSTFWVYDFGLRYDPSPDVVQHGVKDLFQEAFAAVWAGDAESDGFNALVMRAGLTWRQAMVLRAYAKYLRQAGTTFSQDYIESCLNANVNIARLLVRLFEARFDPAYAAASNEVCEALVEEIHGALDAVQSLDQDRILRSLLTLLDATLRTSYFQPGAYGRPKPYVAFKLDPRAIPELPAPRPRFEIWVYSPRFEGVHLRFGSVARGGLRWSDRREDFRTEVLGLVKAQMVKNAVIVPTGAKGGFVLKRAPEMADREAYLTEGVACYRTFITALLDISDNIVGGKVTPPVGVVRRDGDDPYLVVAADKGTATFSDIANGVAVDAGFWLGDAFASGGSAGYDHKAMGITARGAWESVKRHFREMSVDTQTQDFTVCGVGDMSGDVFGNGMLLSEHIRLVAAFDHRHIFIDPSPDAASSYAERRRLFDLPRSSWADYDTSLISAGGGVYPRTAKSVPVSPQAREVLGLPEGTTSLSPPELMRAVLLAPVDLFWNGGIGTYVKSSDESSSDVGDKANDAIRVNGSQLRARVVGEGGNLGLSQLGRIEYALSGGRVNTDAIDNSAGVDTSDHEVNIKILLNGVVADGDLTEKQRNSLLVDMTDDVATHVLRDNYEQNVLLGNARKQSHSMITVHQRFIKDLEKRGLLDRGLEFLPDDQVIEARNAAGIGLTSSEFAVLVAYAKIALSEDLLASDVPDEPWFQGALRGYFPPQLVDRYGERLPGHRLRREIITTCVVNDLVNRGGITFVFRACEETGASPTEVARAYTVAREVFSLADFWAAVEQLDTVVPTDAQTALYLECRRLLDRTVRWILQARRSLLDVAAEIEHFRPVISSLTPRIPELLRGSEQERLQRRAGDFESLGVPADLALQVAGQLDAFSLLDISEIAASTGQPAERVAELYYALSERFQVDRMLTRITALPRDDRWQALARSSLRYDLYSALAGLTSNVLAVGGPDVAVDARIEAWAAANAEGLARTRGTLGEIMGHDSSDLATLSVALRTLRTLLHPSGATG